MYARIGRFKVQLRRDSLLLRHTAGIGFDLTPEEALGLLQFLQVYKQTLHAMRGTTDPETQPVPRIVSDEDDQPDTP